MKNSEWLGSMEQVDVLCSLNDGLKENWQWRPCIISVLGFDLFDRVERCKHYGDAQNKRCRDCIMKWLNEENHSEIPEAEAYDDIQ